MPAKKPPDPKEKPQRQRFIEAGKKAEVDEREFERVMDRITPARKPSKP